MAVLRNFWGQGASLAPFAHFYMVKNSKRNGGFTLFELIVAIAVVALIMGLVIGRTDQYLETDMKTASNKLAATIRYIYNKSITEGMYIRMVFDMNEQTYWVEATRDPLLMTVEGSKERKKKEEEQKKSAEEAPAEGEIPKIEIQEPIFSPVESFLLKPTRLPDPVFFKDIMTEHNPTPQEGGEATINFFPNGYVEHAIINLRDEEDEVHYSLETNPITGRVKITNEYRTFEKK